MLEPKNLPQIKERENIKISLAYIFLYFEKKIFKLSRKNINIFNSTCITLHVWVEGLDILFEVCRLLVSGE